jgi:signal recognition particle subunit SRP68
VLTFPPSRCALALAHDLLSRLAGAAGSAQDEARANEVIDQVEPMLRFCAYELGIDTSRGFDALVKEQLDGGAKDQVEGYDALVEGLSSAAGAEASGSKDKVELAWRGKEVPVRSAQLVEVVGKVQAALAGLSEAKSGKGIGAKRMGAFDKALAVLAEGEEVAREIKDANKVSKNTVRASVNSVLTFPPSLDRTRPRPPWRTPTWPTTSSPSASGATCS